MNEFHPNDPNAPDNLPALAQPVQPSRIGAVASVEQQRAIAEIQAAMIIAQQFPRDIEKVKKEIESICASVSLAEMAEYEYVRGGQLITGPSIRLAEALKIAYRNMRSGWRELSRDNGESEIECFAWDAESNSYQSLTFVVRHQRGTRKGSYALKDDRDIYELCANNAKRRERACILNSIRADVIELAVKKCQDTLLKSVDLSPANVQRMIAAFEHFGVNKVQIEKRIQKSIDAISANNMVTLRRIFNALKDSMGKPEDYFDMKIAAPKDAGNQQQKPVQQQQPAADQGAQQPTQAATPVPTQAPVQQPVQEQQQAAAQAAQPIAQPAQQRQAAPEFNF